MNVFQSDGSVKDEITLTGSYVAFNSTGQHMTRISMPKQLSIPTYEGSGQAVHPSVLQFAPIWNGWKYWMAFTPYPAGNDDYENPSIVVSSDGENWVVPSGLTNPVVPAPADVATGGYNSDPYLVFDRTNNKIIMYYRRKFATGTPATGMFRRQSANGVTWEAEVQCSFAADTQNANLKPLITTIDPVSPSIVRITPTIWYLFFTESSKLYRAKSSDGIVFNHPKEAFHNIPFSLNLWHLDVKFDDSGFHALVSAYGITETNGDDLLYYGYSADGVKWWFDRVPVLAPAENTWYDRQVYKSCFVKSPDGKGARVYMSSQTQDNKWWIGYFDALMAHVTPALDIPVTRTLAASGDAIQIPAAGSLLFQVMLPVTKKFAVMLRTTASISCSVDVEYQSDYHGGLVVYAEKVIPQAVQGWAGAAVDPAGQYAFLRVYNHDAAVALTIHTLQVTLFPD